MSVSREFQSIMKQDGVPGLYRGFWSTCFRDVPRWSVYFGTYEYLKAQNAWINEKYGGSQQSKNMRSLLLDVNAGGTACMLSWMVSIPMDIIKTKQQQWVEKKPLKMREAFQQLK